MSFGKLLTRCSSVLSNIDNVQFTSVRYRYWADKIARGRLMRGFGYKERIFTHGALPRLRDAQELPKPDYRPKNLWSKNRAYFGQNNYIDILGDGRLNPASVSYNVPAWLRGYQGNEFKVMLRKAKTFGNGPYAELFPTALNRIHKRIRYLHKFLNRKTKVGLD